MGNIAIGPGIGPVFDNGAGGAAAPLEITDPTDLANLILWLDASDDTTFTYHSGTLVSQWDDKSGQDNHLAQASSGLAPNHDTVNDLVEFRGSGSGDWLRKDNFTGGPVADGPTVFFVAEFINPQQTVSNNNVFDGGINGFRAIVYVNITVNPRKMGMWNGAGVEGSNIPQDGSQHIFTATFQDTARLWKGGGQLIVKGDAGNTSVMDGCTLGADWFDTGEWTGDIKEFIIYEDIKTNEELDAVGNYLAAKWSLPYVGVNEGYLPDIPGKKLRNSAGSGVTTVSGKVSNWADESGDDNDLFQLTAAKRPVFTDTDADFNNLPVITFDGTDDVLVTNNFKEDMPIPNTIFMVGRWDAVGNFCFDGLTATLRHTYFDSGGNNTVYGGLTNLVGDAIVLTPQIYSFYFDPADYKLYVGGGVSQISLNAGSDTLRGLTLGSSYTQASPWEGAIAEFMIFDTRLSTADHNAIGNELATRYDLSWTDITP